MWWVSGHPRCPQNVPSNAPFKCMRSMPSMPLCTYIKRVPSTSLTHSHAPLKHAHCRCPQTRPSNVRNQHRRRPRMHPSSTWGHWWRWWHTLRNTNILHASKLASHTSLVYSGSAHISGIQSGLRIQLDFERLIIHFCWHKVFFLSLTFVFFVWICCVGWVTWPAWLLGNHARSVDAKHALSMPSNMRNRCCRHPYMPPSNACHHRYRYPHACPPNVQCRRYWCPYNMPPQTRAVTGEGHETHKRPWARTWSHKGW